MVSNMKLAPTQTQSEEMDIPSLFQIATHFDDLFPPDGLAPRISKLPRKLLARFMSQPEKLRAALQSNSLENIRFTATHGVPGHTRRAE